MIPIVIFIIREGLGNQGSVLPAEGEPKDQATPYAHQKCQAVRKDPTTPQTFKLKPS